MDLAFKDIVELGVIFSGAVGYVYVIKTDSKEAKRLAKKTSDDFVAHRLNMEKSLTKIVELTTKKFSIIEKEIASCPYKKVINKE